jgi:hypothetical protein
MEELKLENAFYMAHKAEFHEKYLDKWLVIVGESLWGVFDKFSDAAKAAFQNFKPGEFMIHTPSHDDIVINIGPIISCSTDKEDDDIDSVIKTTEGELVRFQYAY